MVTGLSKEEPARDDGKVIWKTRAELLRVLAHPVRLMILEALSEGPLCVKDLNDLVNIIQPRLSQHMAILRSEKLVACHSCGTLRCYYLLRPAMIRKLIALLRQEHTPRVRDRSYVLREVQRNAKASQTAKRT